MIDPIREELARLWLRVDEESRLSRETRDMVIRHGEILSALITTVQKQEGILESAKEDREEIKEYITSLVDAHERLEERLKFTLTWKGLILGAWGMFWKGLMGVGMVGGLWLTSREVLKTWGWLR